MADSERPDSPQSPPPGSGPTQLPLGGDANKNLIPVNIEDEMRQSYLDYAMSVIVGRALPDVRDGLKPVHNRVLYAMYDGGYRPDRQFSKCSRVVGDVMGKFHPHGDTAIYDALVRLVQDWTMRYPLVNGQGNFGSPGNDPAAAPRYTECRLAPLAMEMVRDIDEELMNRCLVLSVDEGREQTRAIHQFQRRRETLAGLLAQQDRQATLTLHRNAQRLLRPLLVVNPYAEKLTFLDDKTRTRRDHLKYLTLIRAVALLHQYQRPIKTTDHNGETGDLYEWEEAVQAVVREG